MANAPFQFRLRTLLWSVALLGAFIATNGFGIVGLRYPRAFENDPLVSPIQVVAIDGDRLRLADGRVIEVEFSKAPLDQIITKSGYRIDLEDSDDPSTVQVCVKARSWICGTPWARVVNIPLIPDDVPINRRESIGFGCWIEPPPNADADEVLAQQ